MWWKVDNFMVHDIYIREYAVFSVGWISSNDFTNLKFNALHENLLQIDRQLFVAPP